MNRGLIRTVLFDLNLFLGVTAVAGGVALLIGWIKIPLSSLAGSPFSDYTLPAALLVVAVGGTGLLAAWFVRHKLIVGVPASLVAGGTIITFEIVEWTVIGFAWLQAAYIAIGVLIITLATWVRLAHVARGAERHASPHAIH